jgi:hypothetical protein
VSSSSQNPDPKSTTRIVLSVEMRTIAGSEQELVLEGDSIPAGWDSMTDDEKEAAIQPAMEAFLSDEITYGWSERSGGAR